LVYSPLQQYFPIPPLWGLPCAAALAFFIFRCCGVCFFCTLSRSFYFQDFLPPVCFHMVFEGCHWPQRLALYDHGVDCFFFLVLLFVLNPFGCFWRSRLIFGIGPVSCLFSGFFFCFLQTPPLHPACCFFFTAVDPFAFSVLRLQL